MPSFAFSCFFDVVMMFKLPLPILIEKPTVIHCTIWKHTPIDFDKQHYKQQAQLLYIHPVAHPFLIYQVYLNFFNQQSRFSTCTCSSPSTGEIFPNCSIREKQKKPKKKKKKKKKKKTQTSSEKRFRSSRAS